MIIASICTIPVRKHSFQQVAQRILHEQTQSIDLLHVWLNGYSALDDDLPRDARIIYHLEPSNPGPWVRYKAADDLADTDVYVTLDDDLIYPVDYVQCGTSALVAQKPRVSICFGGVLWDWVVPLAKLEYHAHKRLIAYDKELVRDTLVPVLMGGVTFHWAMAVRGMTKNMPVGLETNDDLMTSLHLCRLNHRIVSIIKPSGWIGELPDQNAAHALWRRDVTARVHAFQSLVTEHGFIPWSVDVDRLRHSPAYLAVVQGELSQEMLVQLERDVSAGCILHTLEVIEGGPGAVAKRSLRQHQEHVVGIPEPGGRFDQIVLVHALRQIRNERAGWAAVQQYLEWLRAKLSIQDIVFVEQETASWLRGRVFSWAINAGHKPRLYQL